MRNPCVELRRHPRGGLAPDDLVLRERSVPRPGPGELLCRNILLSIDPAARAWMGGPTYRAQLPVDQVVDGYTIAEVVSDDSPSFPRGTLVLCRGGWQAYACVAERSVRRLTGDGPLSWHLGVLGMTGLTAYFGMLHIGRPKPGETVVVSAAAGATGHIAGQLARIAGARVVGIAGTPEKCRWLEDDLGFDAAVCHRGGSFPDDLHAATRHGVDVYFDGVGGSVLATLLRSMNPHGRIVCCGAISAYDTDDGQVGVPGIPEQVVFKRLRLQGFLVGDFRTSWNDASSALARLVRAGDLTAHEAVHLGLERAPAALRSVLAGENHGKTIVRIASEPPTAADATAAAVGSRQVSEP